MVQLGRCKHNKHQIKKFRKKVLEWGNASFCFSCVFACVSQFVDDNDPGCCGRNSNRSCRFVDSLKSCNVIKK